MSDEPKPMTATELRFRQAVFDGELDELCRRANEKRDHFLLRLRASFIARAKAWMRSNGTSNAQGSD